jgi:hypothetical protein
MNVLPGCRFLHPPSYHVEQHTTKFEAFWYPAPPGLPLVGADVGGFFGNQDPKKTAELMVRRPADP